MLNKSNITAALQERIKESVRLKKELDAAKTSKMLAALEKIQSQGKTNAEPDISDGHSEEES